MYDLKVALAMIDFITQGAARYLAYHLKVTFPYALLPPERSAPK